MKAQKKSVKTVAQKSSNKATKTASATVQAIVLTLDRANDHSIRCACAKQGLDIFATHSMAETSKGYIQQLAQVNRAEFYKTVSKGNVAHLFVNGVHNIVRMGEDGYYGRNGALVVSDFTEKQMLIGNVASLKTLYGAQVELYSELDLRKLYDAQKEVVTRTIGGKGKREKVTGKVIAVGAKGSMLLSVVATLEGEKLMLKNCEDMNNAHNFAHRFVSEKSTIKAA